MMRWRRCRARKCLLYQAPSQSPQLTCLASHLLRKSSTFTGLDFAPPRRFKDPDSMSDAGSIRSNQSGISATQSAAIRSGAGRVSRLPEDMVFSTHQQGTQLKPQWNMRD